jgi:hypothetical protein
MTQKSMSFPQRSVDPKTFFPFSISLIFMKGVAAGSVKKALY